MAVVCNNRTQLLLGCGATALAVALTLAPQRAAAQAFQASPLVVQGDANIDRGTPGQDSIQVNTPTAVIDWTPAEDASGNALEYLPAGNTATFFDAPGQGGFAVLNRILPSTNGNVVVMNGTVITRLQDAAGGFTPGGFVAFYSPTGFLVGSSAVFDVGGLMLTSLDPDLASFDNFAAGAGSLNLVGQTGTTARVTISSGATIQATPENGFFIVAAAGVDVFGNVQVNGSHAYIAAEQVNLTVNNGLFDIVIPVGTSVANAMNINGNVGGPSSTGAGDNHLIYAVAQAAANPIQMLFGGNLGFAPAASAGVVNGEIILAANYDVFGRSVNGGTISDGTLARFTARAETSTTRADIFVTDATITSSTLAIASHQSQVTASAGPAAVDGNLLVISRRNASLSASNGQTFQITGDVLVASDDAGLIGSGVPASLLDANAGSATLEAFGGGTISISGDAVVSADAFTGADTISLIGGAARGGQARMGATGGTLTVGGEAFISARAEPTSIPGLVSAGSMTGGNAQLFANGAANVTIGANLTMFATAVGTNVSTGTVSPGNSAVGGTASVGQSGGAGTITLNGDVLLDASATAGAGNASGVGGGARGGGAFFTTNDPNGVIDVAGDVTLLAQAFAGSNANGDGGTANGGIARLGTIQGTITLDGTYGASASAVGGQGINGGIGTGGIAGVFADRGSVTVGTAVDVQANGTGGGAVFGFGGQGGIGQGGLAFLDAARSAISAASLTVLGSAVVASNGFGGVGGNGNAITPAGQGGQGRGGAFGPGNVADPTFSNGAYALAQADFGTLTVTGQTTLFSDGNGGTGGSGTNGALGGTGGDGIGGTSQAGLYLGLGNGSTGLGSATFAAVTAVARAIGGSGGITVGSPLATGAGGNAFGGFAAMTAPFGTVTAGPTIFNAQAAGGIGSTGGNGTGGTAGFDLQNGGDVTAGNSQAFAAGFGGDSTNGVAGNGTGGLAIFNVANGTLVLNGTGGANFSAPGFGGDGTGGAGGNGTGGSAGGSVTIGSVTVSAGISQDAFGAGGQSIDHAGGNGIGGRARISTAGGTITIGSVFSTNAAGRGGDGTDGGNGTGGIAGAFAGTGSITIGGNMFATTRGFGGNASFGFGGAGGTGIGGNAFAQANGTLTVDASVTIGGIANILADGTGGRGGNSDGTDGPGGRGGDGIGGSGATVNAADPAFRNGAYLLAQGDRGSVTVNGQSQVFAVGVGGDGGNGAGSFAGGAGGNGVGGTAQGGMFVGTGNGSVSAGQVRLADALIRATGIGGSGGVDSTLGFATGNGGNGTGGGAFLTARLSTVQAGLVTVESDGTGGTGANGGIGQGGDAGLLSTNGGTANLGQLIAYARGAGGSGQSGTGGTGTGGEAFIGFQGGTTNITGNATIVADGFGGQSIGADGATGTGGIADIATFTAFAGNATIGGTAQVTAHGFGGQTLGTGFTGGTGQGGEAYLLTQVGGTLQINAAQVAANGIGGSGPSATGGAGTGGIAYIESRDAGSSITISNTPNLTGNLTQSALLVATGGGGNTTGGTGVGGTGTGGTIDVLAANGGTINLPLTGGVTTLVRLFSRGFGGGTSVEGGVGGLGVGGTGTIDVDGGTLNGGPLHLSMFAEGGSSLDTTRNITGGNAQGGNRFIVAQNGGVLNAAFPGGVAGGGGGNGSGTGAGGNAFGGLTNLEVIGGTANLGPGSILVAQNGGGEGATGGNAQGGLATVLVDGGGIINILADASGAPGTFFVGSNAFGGIGTTGAGGGANAQFATVQVNSGSINGGNLIVGANAIGGGSTSGAAGNANAGVSVLTVNTGGTINLVGVRVEADGFGGISASGTHGGANGGDALIQLTGANFTTSGDTVVHSTGTTGRDPASGTTSGTGGAAQGGAALMLVEGASQVTTGKIDLNSNADAFQAGNATGGSSQLQLAHSSVNTAELGLTSVANSRGGAVAAGSSVALVLRDTGGASTLTAGTATFANGASGATSNVAGQALIETTNSTASFDILNIFSTASTGGSATEVLVDGGSIPISGALNIEATGGISISAINGAIVGGPTVTAPTAAIRLDTPGTVTFSGNNDNLINFGGRSLSINSSELDIESGARIGADSISLRSLDTSHTAILGGSTEEAGYTLLQAEAERIEAGDVTFTAPVISSLGANEPDVLIRDLTIVGTLDDGVASVNLNTPGIVRVEGTLVYQDAAATDALSIFAGQRLEVVTPGGIGIVDSSGNPAGVLELNANNLWVGDADLIGQLQADPNFAGRDEALKSAAAGSDDPLGYIRGGSVNLGIGDSLFVRNTGTSEAPGGILIGDGTLSIRFESFSDGSSSSTPISVFAYGAKRNPDGTLVTGEAFYDLVNFNKTATASGGAGTSYGDGSMFNDCDINTDECEGNVEEIIEASPPVNNPTVVEAPTAEPDPVPPAEEETSAEFGVDFPGLVEVNAVTEEGTLDDGVMSGGDSSLYAAADEDDSEDDDEDEDEETGGGE